MTKVFSSITLSIYGIKTVFKNLIKKLGVLTSNIDIKILCMYIIEMILWNYNINLVVVIGNVDIVNLATEIHHFYMIKCKFYYI